MSIWERIGASKCFPLQAGVALFCPEYFLRQFYASGLAGVGERKFLATLSFDVDRERDVQALPELVKLLSRHGIRAGFAVCGAWVERYPAEHRSLADAGFEIINHTHNHPNNDELCPDRFFPQLSAAEMREEIVRCHEAIIRHMGVAPKGFRCPHFGELHTEAVYPILRELGYVYSSSRISVRTALGGWPVMIGSGQGAIAEFPVSTCPRHPHSAFDSWHSLERGRPWHAGHGELVKTLRKLLAIGRECQAYINCYFDPAAIVNLPDRDDFLALFKESGAPLMAGYEEIILLGRVVAEN